MSPPHRISILGEEKIVVGNGIVKTELVNEFKTNPKKYTFIVVLTDSNLAIYSNELVELLKNELQSGAYNPTILQYVITPGEVNKNRKTKADVEDFMLSSACTRDTCLIALGGGVVGDLGGFVAANFMRGIPIIQIPTSLLAMVDSSIGGKTAIDTPHGKNLIGAFHQPSRILIDVAFLKTLPKREFVNGLAEVIKTAAIWMESDFDLLENYPEKILALNSNPSDMDEESIELLTKVIIGSAQVKAHVVTVDEKETGLRGLLNFGHTIGHAIEAIVFPDLLHGECVAIGMVIEAEISRHLGHLNNVSVGRLVSCLQSYGLPVSLSDKIFKKRTKKKCSVDEMVNIMKLDKKNIGPQKRMVLLSAIGKTLEPKASYVPDDIIRRVISPAIQLIPPLESFSTKPEIKLDVPGSKSISNRALVMAALGEGPCRLRGLLHSDDVQVMLDALQKLVGISFSWENGGNTLLIEGGRGRLAVPQKEIYLGNAGTASRFLTSVCSLIKKSEKGKPTILTGNARMKQRPIGPLVKALQENGSQIKCLESEGCFPLEIHPTGLKGGLINLSASVSSQYVSSILISAPYADSPVILDLSGDAVISQPYIDMTIAMMNSFGIKVERQGDSNRYLIPLGIYTNPPEYLIEADASSATYPLAFAAIRNITVTVTNIGSKSLQGDADFAVKVLRPMGCTVVQTDTTTTVTGPKELVPLPHIDMETMTDAFMTATVVAALAKSPNDHEQNTTRITGIANQRVKECDRIAVMIEQLDRLGVKATALPDGLQIHGIDRNNLKPIVPSGIKCYDDHRIAMSFSVLGCGFPSNMPGLIITEKKCVEKTWPSWWDTLQNALGVDTVGVDLELHDEEHCVVSCNPERSVILIGMRGAGKTHMGRAAAFHLSRKFIDMDQYLEEEAKMTIPEFIEKKGWVEFRLFEIQCLDKVMREKENGFVIACGGGIVEAESNRAVLKAWDGLVVHIRRDIDGIESYLNIDTTRPMYGEDMRAVWKRREPWYRECSNSNFFVISTSSSPNRSGNHYEKVEQAFAQYLRFKLSTTPFPMPSSDVLSFFTSLTAPNIKSLQPIIDDILIGTNAIELRVDLLENQSDAFISEQISLLRVLSTLPIVFTVRTKSQGGKFPNDDFESLMHLWLLGIKLGCEYIDVEFSLPFNRFQPLLKLKGGSRIIGSYHDVAGIDSWDANGVMAKKYCQFNEYCDVVKLIGKANDFADNFALYKFRHEIVPSLKLPFKPLIALLMGVEGKLSRSLNTFLTPVTHPLLTNAAAPGQVSISDIQKVRHGIGLLPARSYCLFGLPISQSMSPTLHNAGFEALGFPYTYTLEETDNIEYVKSIMKSKDGASVTIPLKIEVLNSDLCSFIDPAAKAIGAVNTLVKEKDGSISGYNTDWIGIKRKIHKYLPSSANAIGIVLGAGGTSRAALYALKNIPQIKKIKIWNRTHSKAETLSQEFNVEAVSEFTQLLIQSPEDKAFELGSVVYVVVGTIPASAQLNLPIKEMLSDNSDYDFGIALDMAYRPRDTPLTLAARSRIGSKKWFHIEGIDVLLEQGYEQFKLWTEMDAPRSIMETKVMEKY